MHLIEEFTIQFCLECNIDHDGRSAKSQKCHIFDMVKKQRKIQNTGRFNDHKVTFSTQQMDWSCWGEDVNFQRHFVSMN